MINERTNHQSKKRKIEDFEEGVQSRPNASGNQDSTQKGGYLNSKSKPRMEIVQRPAEPNKLDHNNGQPSNDKSLSVKTDPNFQNWNRNSNQQVDSNSKTNKDKNSSKSSDAHAQQGYSQEVMREKKKKNASSALLALKSQAKIKMEGGVKKD